MAYLGLFVSEHTMVVKMIGTGRVFVVDVTGVNGTVKNN